MEDLFDIAGKDVCKMEMVQENWQRLMRNYATVLRWTN